MMSAHSHFCLAKNPVGINVYSMFSFRIRGIPWCNMIDDITMATLPVGHFNDDQAILKG